MYNLISENYLFAFLLTCFAGLSTTIGAVLAFFTRYDNKRVLSVGLGFSAGVMIYVSFVEILAKSRDSFNEIYANEALAEFFTTACFFLGIIISAFIDFLIPKDINPHEIRKDRDLAKLKLNHSEKLDKLALKRTGIFTAIAIAIHNFPEGFATFISSLSDITLGIPIAFAIAIHNIPEGIAVSLPIYQATKNRKKAFYYATLSGLAEPVGAIIGFFLLYSFMGAATLGITFGIIAGIMVFISFDELLPAARAYGNTHTTIWGISLGMLVMSLSLVGFKLIG